MRTAYIFVRFFKSGSPRRDSMVRLPSSFIIHSALFLLIFLFIHHSSFIVHRSSFFFAARSALSNCSTHTHNSPTASSPPPRSVGDFGSCCKNCVIRGRACTARSYSAFAPGHVCTDIHQVFDLLIHRPQRKDSPRHLHMFGIDHIAAYAADALNHVNGRKCPRFASLRLSHRWPSVIPFTASGIGSLKSSPSTSTV